MYKQKTYFFSLYIISDFAFFFTNSIFLWSNEQAAPLLSTTEKIYLYTEKRKEEKIWFQTIILVTQNSINKNNVFNW